MPLRRNSNDESEAQLASTGDTVTSQWWSCVPLRSLCPCECNHLSAFVRMKSVYECGHMAVSECAWLCVRAESRAARLETALERRVIDKYRPPGFFQPNYHRIGSSRQTVYTPVCPFLFLSCTHISIVTPAVCPNFVCLAVHGKLAHLIYCTSEPTKYSSITLALILWKPKSTGHWFAILNTWAEW